MYIKSISYGESDILHLSIFSTNHITCNMLVELSSHSTKCKLLSEIQKRLKHCHMCISDWITCSFIQLHSSRHHNKKRLDNALKFRGIESSYETPHSQEKKCLLCLLNGNMQFSLTRSCFYAVFSRCYKENVRINATVTNCKIRK